VSGFPAFFISAAARYPDADSINADLDSSPGLRAATANGLEVIAPMVRRIKAETEGTRRPNY
jgi:hypothetical protein